MNKKINREPSALGKLLAFSLACLIPDGTLQTSVQWRVVKNHDLAADLAHQRGDLLVVRDG